MEVAETAQATAQAAHALTQLSVLLSSQGLLFGKAARHTVRQGAAVKAAGQESSVWSGGAAASPLQARSLSAISSSIQCQSVPTPCQSVPTPSLIYSLTYSFVLSCILSIPWLRLLLPVSIPWLTQHFALCNRMATPVFTCRSSLRSGVLYQPVTAMHVVDLLPEIAYVLGKAPAFCTKQ